ncbi:hypothetical protein Mp_zg00250 [Marchantia polymorpha subsp. ruderalis]|uniref:Uncharacterized protein n=2 Tax=Marchantia polymorpha TaxID=3197 RepID=A0A679E5S6_MARPO|nr:hypothetical protein MARPO_0134s0043 [Marchantia polymorpha]BBN20694.1 hypothetical protein Mp_zg00250 [Marchantia polymorpha subsp. ruderalis]|eukprot:PTQ29835.1 hypothetical protein MARPO_0134s0043 [Marchantia polymorpha]
MARAGIPYVAIVFVVVTCALFFHLLQKGSPLNNWDALRSTSTWFQLQTHGMIDSVSKYTHRSTIMMDCAMEIDGRAVRVDCPALCTSYFKGRKTSVICPTITSF